MACGTTLTNAALPVFDIESNARVNEIALPPLASSFEGTASKEISRQHFSIFEFASPAFVSSVIGSSPLTYCRPNIPFKKLMNKSAAIIGIPLSRRHPPLNHITYLNYICHILRETLLLFEVKSHMASNGIAIRKSESTIIGRKGRGLTQAVEPLAALLKKIYHDEDEEGSATVLLSYCPNFSVYGSS